MNSSRIKGNMSFLAMLGFSATIVLAGIWAAWRVEHVGHILNGINNSVPWGFPLVLATFLIVAASGALNLASISSVFGKQEYKPLASFSCLLALAMLAGGLFSLMLDLGRPMEVLQALTLFNFTSVFSINIIIYTVFFVVVGIYWMFSTFSPHGGATKAFGFASFIWRLVMTTGTGSVFAVLAGRSAMHTALLPPLFIALSLSLGLAMSIVSLHKAQMAAQRDNVCSGELVGKLRGLLATLVGVTFYMVLALHLIGISAPATREFERFVLVDGGGFPKAFWGGFVLLGTVMPLLLLKFMRSRAGLLAAALCVVGGSLALVHVLVIAPQVFPADIFPGKIVDGAFYGKPAEYGASFMEWLVGACGIGLAGVIMLLGMRVFPVLPDPNNK